MEGARKTALFWACLLSAITVAHGEENTGIIVASIVTALLLLILLISVTIYCFYRQGSFTREKKSHKHRKHHVHQANGFHPPQHKSHRANGYAKTKLPPPQMPPQIQPVHMPPMYPYATYSGPPPEIHIPYGHEHQHHGTFSGPPPVAIVPTQFGSVAVRPDPRPVVHSRKYKKHHSNDKKHKSPSRNRQEPQEYVVQPSYDGIPIVRPVIYVDDKDDRPRHRSKSRDRKSNAKESSSSEPRIMRRIYRSEIKADYIADTRIVRQDEPETDIRTSLAVPKPRSPSPQRVSPVRSPVRSRASSVTEAVNALRMSVQGHLDDDDEATDTPHSSKAPSLRWTTDRRSRAPNPAAGDVMFYPAGQQIDTERHVPTASTSQNEYSKSIRVSQNEEPELPPRAPITQEPEPVSQTPEPPKDEPREDVYSYSRIIRSSRKAQSQTILAPVQNQEPVNQGYEVPSQLRKTTGGIRDDLNTYETEHTQLSKTYTDRGGASMSDRLANLVEDGDKTRFTNYSIGAMNFGPEEDGVQMRRSRPRTPPVDIPRNSAIYSQSIKRPATPPSDIPLISPRESTEIPPLNLRSSVTTPRADYGMSPRPSTPPQDFPITPKSSIVRPRPPTPPFDAETARSTAVNQTTNLRQSTAIDPSSGQPGSFQARQRLIEAHLMKNVSPNQPGDKTASVQFNKKTEVIPRSEPTSARDSVPTVVVPAGVIPPPPPPPPLPK